MKPVLQQTLIVDIPHPEEISKEQRNTRLLYAHVAVQALFTGGPLAFIAVFLVRLGASALMVGLLTSLPALAMMIVVLPLGGFVQRRNHLVQTTNWGRVVYRGMISTFALLPLLPASMAPAALVAIRCISTIPQALQNISLTALFGKVTSGRRRAQFLSTRMAIHSMIKAVVGLGAGFWLDRAPYPLNYQVLFGCSVLAALISAAILSRVRIAQDSSPPPSSSARFGPREMLPLIRENRPFRNYLIGSLVYRSGLALSISIIPIYRIRTLGASDGWIGILLTTTNVLQMVTFFVLGRLLRRPRIRRRLWIAGLGMAFVPLTTALASTATQLLIPAILGGILGACFTIYLSSSLHNVSPDDQRPLAAAVNSFTMQATRFVPPLLGAMLAEWVGIPLVLGLSALVRLAGALLFWRLSKRPQSPQTATPVAP